MDGRRRYAQQLSPGIRLPDHAPTGRGASRPLLPRPQRERSRGRVRSRRPRRAGRQSAAARPHHRVLRPLSRIRQTNSSRIPTTSRSSAEPRPLPTPCSTSGPGTRTCRSATMPESTLDAILDRAINVLVVPGRNRRNRRVRAGADGERAAHHPSVLHVLGDRDRPEHPTLAVACSRAEPAEWARAVIDSLPPDDSAVRGHWLRVVSERLDSGAVVRRGAAGAGARPDRLSRRSCRRGPGPQFVAAEMVTLITVSVAGYASPVTISRTVPSSAGPVFAPDCRGA